MYGLNDASRKFLLGVKNIFKEIGLRKLAEDNKGARKTWAKELMKE